MLLRLAPLLKLVAATFLVLILIDVAIFRSGAYTPVIKPDSTGGSVVGAMMAIDQYYDPAKKNILVLGNSQIGEGFSAETADAQGAAPNVHFINGSIAGTTPRVWDYLLREMDPDRRRFSAIALMVDYDLDFNWNDLTNYSLDLSYTTTPLKLGDLRKFPQTFTDRTIEGRARREILLPMQALHDDIQDLIARPLRRIHEISKVRPIWLGSLAVYGGRGGELPALAVDTQTAMPTSWGAFETAWKPKLGPYFRDIRKTAPPATRAANENYERIWVGRIAAHYRAVGVPVIVFNMARGPWKAELLPSPAPNRALAELSAAGDIALLPGDAFIGLEKPEYFIDTLHLNSVGREKFSKLFALQVAPLVH